MKYWFAAGAFVLGSWVATAPAKADGAQGAEVQELLSALDLPVQANALRQAGAAEADIGEALRVLRERPAEGEGKARRAARAQAVLEAEREAAREHGPMRDLGEFVREKLDDDVHGQELAEAIRAQRDLRQPAGRGQERAEQASDRAAVGDEQSAEAADRAKEDQARGRQASEGAGEGRARDKEAQAPRGDDAREDRARGGAEGAVEKRPDRGTGRGQSPGRRDAGSTDRR